MNGGFRQPRRQAKALIAATLSLGAVLVIGRGATPLPTLAAAHTNCVPILMYHRIAPLADPGHDLGALVIDPLRFDGQLKALHDAGWRTVTAAQFGAALVDDRRLPERTFVITIDDGYADGATYGLPILERYGYRATFFVVPGRVEEGDPRSLTWDQIRTLTAAGMDIGNHTVSHVWLPGLSPAQARWEIEYANRLIAEHAGVQPTTFAYPFGDDGSWVSGLVAQEGFSVAFTNHGTCSGDPRLRWEEPRMSVGPWTTPWTLVRRVINASLGLKPLPSAAAAPAPAPICPLCDRRL